MLQDIHQSTVRNSAIYDYTAEMGKAVKELNERNKELLEQNEVLFYQLNMELQKKKASLYSDGEVTHIPYYIF